MRRKAATLVIPLEWSELHENVTRSPERLEPTSQLTSGWTQTLQTWQRALLASTFEESVPDASLGA